MTRTRERGFTLIELMVALVVSSLLVGMILAIFSRMSMAYRGQQQIAGVQQVLSAARATIEFDAKQAGLGMAQGFFYAGDNKLHQPVRVLNNNAGPDQIAFFYGDASTQAAVVGNTGWPLSLTVDATTGFAPGSVVLISVADLTSFAGIDPAKDANIAKYSACALEIATVGTVAPFQITFKTVAPWGRAGNTHCSTVPATGGGATMMYRLVARGYRIDTSTTPRAVIGPLQASNTGGLLAAVAGFSDTWEDLAYGFTDIQTALQVYDPNSSPTDTADPDTDGSRDWYSGAMQDTLTDAPPVLTGTDGLLQMSISLVARTDRDVEGISTPATPTLTDATRPNNNSLGDRASVPLPSTTDDALKGSRIYRYTTFQVDFRNLGVGR